jgi:hypothetical protein
MIFVPKQTVFSGSNPNFQFYADFSPTSASIAPSGSVTFTATVGDTAGLLNPAQIYAIFEYVWTVNGATVQTVSNTASTPPSLSDSYTFQGLIGTGTYTVGLGIIIISNYPGMGVIDTISCSATVNVYTNYVPTPSDAFSLR